VARREVLVFIALEIHRFDDVRLTKGKQLVFPRLNTKEPSLGIMMPMVGKDVCITVNRYHGRDTLDSV
jgi:hypothetical protein